MKLHYDDIASASPKDLRRLLEWLKVQSPVGAPKKCHNPVVLPPPGDTAGLVKNAAVAIDAHCCDFRPFRAGARCWCGSELVVELLKGESIQ